MSTETAIAGILKATASAAATLGELLGDVDQFGFLLRGLGHETPAGLSLAALAPKIGDLQTDLSHLGTAADALDPDADDIVPGVVALGEAFAAVCSDVADLATTPIPSGLPAPLDTEAFWVDLAENALAHVIHLVMAERAPKALAILELLGVAEIETRDETGLVVTRPAAFRWADLPRLVSDPVGLVRDAYGWGGSFDQERLITAVTHVAYAFGLAGRPAAPQQVVSTFWDVEQDDTDDMTIHQVSFPFVTRETVGSAVVQRALEVGLLGIPDEHRTGAATGFALTLQAEAGMSLGIAITDTVSLRLEGDLQGGAVVALRDGDLGVSTAVGGSLAARLGGTVTARPAVPWAFGDPKGTRLETARLGLQVTVAASTSGEPPEVTLRVDGDFTAYLDLSGGDSFVTALLGGESHALPFTTGVLWSSRTGLRFLGAPGGGDGAAGAHLSTTIPVNLDLAGVLRLSSVTLDAGAAERGAALMALATGRLSLGPFTVTFKGIGVAATVAAPADGAGNLGPLDVGFALAGPEAIGLSISAAAVSGGGYLEVDREAGRYVGVAELTLLGTVSVKAIGIITTRMPDGSDGFALLLLITAEGFTPVQLGMGFALTGIGGLIALNRTVDADVVRGGLKDGILDSVLFVKDPVKNADRVISTLDQVFPLAKDRLVVGPLAEISWGTPAIVHLRLALLLDLPMPVRAVILAALSVTLPKPEAPVVEIHVDAIGVLDLAKGQLALDASLHDSRILSFTLTGDLALRLDWGGSNPGFLLSVGGFHPRFRPPPGLRPLNRLALQLTSGSNPLVRFEAYLAVTSNTLQLGARASVKLEVGGFAVEGGGSFDTLVQWSPFHLEVDVAAWVRITAGGATILSLSLALSVTGPAPWHLTGTAEFHILLISVSVHVDLTLGQSSTATVAVEAVDVPGLIWDAVSTPSAWQAVLPASVTPGATTSADVSSDRVLAHPLATVSVRQKIAPLGIRVTHVGARVPKSAPAAYTLTLTAPNGAVATPLSDLFARAQYAEVPAEQRLSAPSFESFASGVQLAPAAAATAGPSTPCLAVVDTLDLTTLDAPATAGLPAAAIVSSGGLA